MSYYDKYNQSDWRLRSNGLNKSSSQSNYFSKKDLELSSYNKNYLPLIKLNQQADIYSKQIDKSNKIKDEILNSKYKLLRDRGVDNYDKNKYRDSWTNFFKRKEREKQRRKMYKIIKDQSYSSSEEEDNANDIFRNGYSMLTKIEDKIKLKKYLPAKRDLTKLMMKVNDNINDRVDLNNYLLSKNIRNLENGYDDLRDMIENKINKMERKQEEDFYDLRKYFKRRAQREDDKFNNNFQNDEENNYFNPNMKENIEKLQTYEIAKKIQSIPNLLDNFVQNIEGIRQYRQQEKNDFLIDFNNSLRGYNNNPLYENLDFDLNNNLNDYKYGKGNYYNYDDISEFNNSYFTGNSFKYRYSKPKSEIINRHLGKNFLSMSQSDIDKLRKNLKPLSYQNKYDDRDDRISGEELMEIYKQRNKNKKKNYNSNNMNIQENQVVNKIKEKEDKKTENTKKKETDDVVVVDSEEDKKESINKDKKEESKKSESDSDSDDDSEKDEKKEENKEEKKEEKKSESDSDDDDDDDDDDNEKKDG